MSRIVYSRHYNIGAYGLERLHPFDTKKYGRAWKVIRNHFGARLRKDHVRLSRSASVDELQLVHSPEYLQKLHNAKYLAGALELPALNRLPAWAIDWHVLRPMRWATRGTIVAADEAISTGLAINLGGGFHHAKFDRGEGFSIYSDIGISVAAIRKANRIDEDNRIVYIDTDAHQGNGVCHTFMTDSRVFIFDVFNSKIYPMFDVEARRRIDCEVPVSSDTTNLEYLDLLKTKLPGFLDSVCHTPVGLAIYNAGTDVFASDPLGLLNLSAETILKRDLFVVDELRKRKIPTVMVLSGGYTLESFRLIASSVIGLLEYSAK